MAAALTTGGFDLGYFSDADERALRERYDLHFYRELLASLPPSTGPVVAVDLAADEGLAALDLFSRLAPGSRLVAVTDDARPAERLHTHAKHAFPSGVLGRRFFIRREDLTRLVFADGVFDLAYACLPFGELPEPRSVLAQALRVLRPGGTLIITTALASSLLELARAVAQAELDAGGEVAAPTVTGRLAARAQLATAAEWKALLARIDGVQTTVQQTRFELTLSPDAASDPLFTSRLVPLYLGCSSEHVAIAPRLLAQAIKAPLTTSVHIATLRAQKPTVPAAPTAPAP
jgi:SAM-dependent methyltransferase